MNELIKINPAQQYAATIDSVNLINSEKPEAMSDSEWEDCIKRNREHIKIMLAKDFWTDEDLTPFEKAVA
jgi:hypothetical protein